MHYKYTSKDNRVDRPELVISIGGWELGVAWSFATLAG